MGLINGHLLITARTCVLVDTGLPGSERKILRVLHTHGLCATDIKLIVITHAHVDHAGSAARMRELSGAPIVAHEADLDYYLQKKAMHFCATGWFGRLFLRTGLILQPYTPFIPDILLQSDQTLPLQAYGLEGTVQHTAGHTPGSIALQLASGDALVGDLLASGILLGGLIRTDHAIRPPFEDDAPTVANALERLVSAGMLRFYMGHGGPLDAHEVRRHASHLRTLGPPSCTQSCAEHH